MNLQIINGCAGTDPGLLTAGTDHGRRYAAELSKQPTNEYDSLCISLSI